jgi:hypothetical protein
MEIIDLISHLAPCSIEVFWGKTLGNEKKGGIKEM